MEQIFVRCKCGFHIPTGAPEDLLDKYHSSPDMEPCPQCKQQTEKKNAYFGRIVDLGNGKYEAQEIVKDSK